MHTQKKTILIIDDDPDILEATRFILEDEGYTVITKEKGEYAENLAGEQDLLPDLIILDVLLSGKDGRTICKKLKAEVHTTAIPIIMVSAHPNAAKSVEEVGANAFLAKPFNIDDLINLVATYTKM